MENKKEIDWRETVGEDDINEALDNLKGVTALLQALELATDIGTHKYQKEAYLALGNICHRTIQEFEEMKPKLDYMDTKMREGR